VNAVKDKCLICGKPAEAGAYLCKDHTRAALEVLNTGSTENVKYTIIENPVFMNHCQLCGEWENRKIICYPSWNYLCEPCITEAKGIYKL
jgi:hypothetical protein